MALRLNGGVAAEPRRCGLAAERVLRPVSERFLMIRLAWERLLMIGLACERLLMISLASARV
ncbi:hypothetical protein GCM10011579_051640 [Streptomyces albiflavescens]|uniref:Uncharacterized protein n=1 Tax=Streptomyces albiflavescens TaxID=1623582 RepID=A0A917Y9E1_9ACTN|nr:hypothetical protein GCM10011579_051640 [Streptomyces albiflavescens]